MNYIQMGNTKINCIEQLLETRTRNVVVYFFIFGMYC